MSEASVPPPPANLERQSSESLDIPKRTVVVKDPSELPASYSMTPGGTLYSTTPGGTRIIYDRKFLLQMRNSPYSRTPPVKLPVIPDIIAENGVSEPPPSTKSPDPPITADHTGDPDEPFHFEIES